ncbi:hypothetical protein AAG570_006484 [Ranatra chinensis]|uniref:Zinc transporter ZIP1 n=1 Tax=Ranatra chinensis TaxID=642074 RepID=A0ABD0YU69_9HEMI
MTTVGVEDGAGADLTVAKVTCTVLLGLASLVAGLLPIKLVSWFRWKGRTEGERPAAVALLLCFGGGVLLFTTFMHLQPEVREATERLIAEGRLPDTIAGSKINLAELVFCCGFFFVYAVEEAVHAVLDRGHAEDDEEMVLHRSMSVRRCPRAGGRHLHDRPPTAIPRVNPEPRPRPARGPLGSGQVLIGDPLPLKTADTASSASATTAPPDDAVAKSFRGLLAVVALSFHAVFEGLAVGLERSPTNVWTLSGALATHKLVIAFCVGVELVSSGTKVLLIFIYVATFAAVTPLGIGLGLGMSLEGGGAPGGLPVASVVLQGMAAGTLLYVVFFEVLQREKGGHRHGIARLVAIIVGFLVMLALQILCEFFLLISVHIAHYRYFNCEVL